MPSTSLLILAAGLGTRYQNLKQLDSLGENQETLLDYAIYDAIETGFSKIVLIVRDCFRKQISSDIEQKWRNKIQFEFICQNTNDVPKRIDIRKNEKNLGEQPMLFGVLENLLTPHLLSSMLTTFMEEMSLNSLLVFLKIAR